MLPPVAKRSQKENLERSARHRESFGGVRAWFK